MKVRRCTLLLIEPKEEVAFDLDLLLQGGDGLRRQLHWVALAPHLGAEVPIDTAELCLLGKVSALEWVEAEWLYRAEDETAVDRLMAKGLILSDSASHAAWLARDVALRDTYWQPHSAVSHYLGRWEGIRGGEAARKAGLLTMSDMVEKFGPPPPHFLERTPRKDRLVLERGPQNELDVLLGRRVTCRNFDTELPLDSTTFGHLLKRVFGAQALQELAEDLVVVKKTSPSGGGLHPLEAYLVVQRVQGILPGLYHYHPGDHALEPLPLPGGADLRQIATTAVAAQDYYAEAAVLVVLAARFKRNFWKYRLHTKAYRAVVLDAGHLSQTLYLSATEYGLGAFVTAAINEVDIERAFGLDPAEEGPLAVCGFGPRAAQRTTIELDPLGAVWPGGTG